MGALPGLIMPADAPVRPKPTTAQARAAARARPESTAVTPAAQGQRGSDERPIRELGALSLKPIETSTGYYLQDTAGNVHTDGSTLAISFKPLNGLGGPARGGLSGQIGSGCGPRTDLTQAA